MAIKNITTSISADKTIMEIEQILAKFGAKAILKEYEGSFVTAISFYLEYQGQKIPFKMPMNVERARRMIDNAVNEGKLPKKFKHEPHRTEQAIRVSWRVFKEWIHINCSLLEMKFAEPMEILLAYAYNPIEKKTMYELFMQKKDKLLSLESDLDE